MVDFFLTSTFNYLHNWVATHFEGILTYLPLIALGVSSRELLEWFWRTIYTPYLIARFNFLNVERFEGLDSSFKPNFLIQILLYSLFNKTRRFELISKPKEPILSITAYNKSAEARSNKYLNKCKKNIENIAKDHEFQLVRVDFLISSINTFCSETITGELTWLFIHCVGGIFGAVYSDDRYFNLVKLVSKLTIEDEHFNEGEESNLNLLLEILSYLVYSENENDTRGDDFRKDVIKKVYNFPRDNGRPILLVDKVKIVRETLIIATKLAI